MNNKKRLALLYMLAHIHLHKDPSKRSTEVHPSVG
jgi:hypothetical protein